MLQKQGSGGRRVCFSWSQLLAISHPGGPRSGAAAVHLIHRLHGVYTCLCGCPDARLQVRIMDAQI